MRFATFSRGGAPEVGAVWPPDGMIWPLRDGPLAFSGDMSNLAESYDELSVDLIARGPALKISEVRLLAPILTPRRNIFCVGKNYKEHAKEFSRSGFDASATEIPEVPIIFTKSSGSVIGPQADICSHSDLTQGLDYEAELGVVIGRGGRAISRAAALSHVWGYTIINDVTARDLQRSHQQWFIGKSLDTFCPMGPWIVTADEIDPQTPRHLMQGERGTPPARQHRRHDLRCGHADRSDFKRNHAASCRYHSDRNAGRRGRRIQATTFSKARRCGVDNHRENRHTHKSRRIVLRTTEFGFLLILRGLR